MFEALRGIVNCPVLVIAEDLDRELFNGRPLTMMAGGFCSTTLVIQEPARSFIREHSLFEFPEDYFDNTFHGTVQVILIRDEVYNAMSPEDVEAMICHEFGHILSKDPIKYLDQNVKPKPEQTKLQLVPEDEIRADQVCADILGKERMSKAIKANVQTLLELHAGRQNRFQKFLFGLMYKYDPVLRKRLKALA